MSQNKSEECELLSCDYRFMRELSQEEENLHGRNAGIRSFRVQIGGQETYDVATFDSYSLDGSDPGDFHKNS